MNWRMWWTAHFDHGKTHFFPEELKERLLANLEERGMPLLTDLPQGEDYKDWPLHETVEVGLARSGARMVDDSWMQFELVDVLVGFYAADVEWYIDVIRESPPRLELGTPYYKIHGDLHCLCLLPEDRDLLIQKMEAELEKANALRDIDFQRYNEAMKHIRECPYVDPGEDRPVRPLKHA